MPLCILNWVGMDIWIENAIFRDFSLYTISGIVFFKIQPQINLHFLLVGTIATMCWKFYAKHCA